MNEFLGQSYGVDFLEYFSSAPISWQYYDSPVGKVRVHISRGVLFDIVGSRVALWIASNDLVVLWLVDANVVYSHSSGKILRNFFQVDGCETVRHSEIGNDRQRFLGDGTCANIAVGADRWGVHGPGLVSTNIPCNEAIGSGLVFK